MAVILEQDGPQCLIRLEGEIGMSSAAELKKAFSAGLTSGKELRIDLERTTEFGVTALQLCEAIAREAAAAGLSLTLVGRLPEAVSVTLRDAGLEKFPITRQAEEG